MIDVSIIIPVFNAGPYVKEATLSALEQPETRDVILVEDGSSDNSLDVCQWLERADKRVRFIRHPDKGNHGAGASRNLGIKASLCEYIAFLDADDFLLPNRFSMTSEVFYNHPEIDGVYEAVGTCFENEAANRLWISQRGAVALTTIKKKLHPNRLFRALLISGLGAFHTDGVTAKPKKARRKNQFGII